MYFKVVNTISEMSSPDRGPDRSPSKTMSSLLWDTMTNMLPMSTTNSTITTKRTAGRPDMADVTYMMDMDGEGLCFHAIYQAKQAFNKSN